MINYHKYQIDVNSAITQVMLESLMNNHVIIKQIESTRARLSKEQIILEQMHIGNDVLFKGMNMAYNKLLTFGVKKIPLSTISGKGITWNEFEFLAKRLLERELTGHAARDEILKLMSCSYTDEWNFFYKRILQKDMRCGVSEKTINNVAVKNDFTKYSIPVFACQLAQD